MPKLSSWPCRGGHVDPFRPTIEPDAFTSLEELETNRRAHLAQVVRVFEEADLFIFTLGLTEYWYSFHDGAVLPLAPGVAGGTYDAADYGFQNLTCRDVTTDMDELFALARTINPDMRFILTVSPVPLAATATDEHVIVATSYSKAVLRAACGELTSRYGFVDYFPSYEIISSPPMQGAFYEPDGRNVSREGAEHVMRQFLAEHRVRPADAGTPRTSADAWEEAACEEELLAFAARRP